MNHKTPDDPEADDLRELLQGVVPNDPFDSARLKARIEVTLAAESHAARWIPRPFITTRGARVAAALALFVGGVWLGRASAPTSAATPSTSSPAIAGLDNSRLVGASIQSAGTNYVKAIRDLRAAQSTMDADGYRENVMVALTALAAAARELGTPEDREVSRLAFEAMFQQGIALSTTATPAVMYR
jgi:hypothetical protein